MLTAVLPNMPPMYLFSKNNLMRFASRIGEKGGKILMMDFDGTLAGIQRDPDKVALSPSIYEALKKLSPFWT